LVWAPVTSVSMPSSGSPVLNVAGIGNVDISAVRQIG
jgi:flagellar basal-body rod modification protein FlgD